MKSLMQKLGWLYRALYYRFYLYSQKADSRFAKHYAHAVIYLTMIVTLNLFSLLVGYAMLGGRIPFLDPILASTPKWAIFFIAIGIVLIHTAFIKHKGRYKKIINEFSKESPEEQRRRDLWFTSYVVTTFFILIGLVVFSFVMAVISS